MIEKANDWDSVHRANFQTAAFWDERWIQKAKDLYAAAKKLEPEIRNVWENLKAHHDDHSIPLIADHYNGPYFMLIAYCVENLLKAAIISKNSVKYRDDFHKSQNFPEELKKHDLIKLAELCGLPYNLEEEYLLRRLTRSSLWFGRYPVPLHYPEMSGAEMFKDGEDHTVSWFSGKDIDRIEKFILELPARLCLNTRYWDSL